MLLEVLTRLLLHLADLELHVSEVFLLRRALPHEDAFVVHLGGGAAARLVATDGIRVLYHVFLPLYSIEHKTLVFGDLLWSTLDNDDVAITEHHYAAGKVQLLGIRLHLELLRGVIAKVTDSGKKRGISWSVNQQKFVLLFINYY